MPSLFSPTNLGQINLSNRVVMAPMTRARTTQPGNIPNALMAEYYAQRASAGLIISEATQITPQGQGYSFTPGIHSDAQIEGWKLVTDAVHRAGGKVFLQLWHVGRMSHESFHADGKPVAPSALNAENVVWVADDTGAGDMVPTTTPRALSLAEISEIIDDYRQAAANAITAGFDGVELHGANGYLIDQFLRATSNQRDDQYGGSAENRIRFVTEVAEAVAAEIGADKVGLRISPFVMQRNMEDPTVPDTALLAVREMQRIGLAYIHLGEADLTDAPETPDQWRHDLRAAFPGTIIVAGKYTSERGQKILDAGLADLVAFGRPFVANPDLPYRMENGVELADLDPTKLFGGDADGYSSYPAAPVAAE